MDKPADQRAAFGIYPSSGKRPERLNVSRDVNMPAQVARGWVAGTLGLPGDIEGLGRMALGLAGADVSETPVLPTSDFYREYLPGYDPAPAARAASGLGALAGGAGSTKVVRGALSGAKATGRALGPKAAEMAEGYLQRSGLAPTVVKPKGGNWLSGSVEGATQPLKTHQNPAQEVAYIRGELERPQRGEVYQQLVGRLPQAEREDAINNWIDTKLNKYIRNEMATPEDPVRKLAERGVTHLPEGNLERANEWTPDTLGGRRKAAGFPEEGYATTPAGRGWEQLADEAIHNMPASERIKQRPAGYQDPDSWLDKVPPETMTYGVYRGIAEGDELGLPHLIDELRNATRADSDLPANLRWKPEDLKKVTMEQAVERVAKINEYRAAKKAEANEVLARNPATAPYKDYETVPGTQEPNSKGLAWKQIKQPGELPEGWTERGGNVAGPEGAIAIKGSVNDPRRKALEDALKYEGDVMGHCVGGYCDDVLEGRSQIYSLRDKKGEPHVTIETRPMENYELQAANMKRAGASSEEIAAFFANPPHEIIQIKGKGNAAPKAEYLPFVQDFVRSGNWSKVGDLKNTGLIKLGDQYLPKEEVGPLVERASRFIEETPALREHREAQRAYENYSGPVPSAEYTALQRAAGRQVHPTIPYTYRELRAILDDPDAFADRNTDALAPNLERIERLRQLVGEQGYAKGGLVEDTDAIVAKLTSSGMDKDKALTQALRMANAKQEAHMAAGGFTKLLKGAKQSARAHPLEFPAAAPLTKADIAPMAQRIAEQMSGQFVRPDPKKSVNPAGKSRKVFEREKTLPLEVKEKLVAKDVPVMDYEAMKDAYVVGVPGDATLGNVAAPGTLGSVHEAGVELRRLGDVEFGPDSPTGPVQLFGGPRYGLRNFWASNLGPAQGIQNTVNELGQLGPVYGQYIKMSPESTNFALHNLDALLAYQQPERLSKAKRQELTRAVREGSPKYGKFPGFAGFDDPIDVLLQAQINSDLRKHVAETLMGPKLTGSLGMRPGSDVLFGITTPELRNLELGVSGYSIGKMAPGADLVPSLHPTYDFDIPGTLVGQSKYPVPYEIAFPRSTAYTRANLKPGAQEFNTLKMIGAREKIDPQYIDQIKMYEELMKQYTGKKKGGAVKPDGADDFVKQMMAKIATKQPSAANGNRIPN